MAGIVVIFDFDKTIIDCDSDNWVVDDLGATCRFDDILRTTPWNTAIDKMMGELHSHGRTISEISDILRRAPLFPNTISAIKSAYALGCELRIVSDANLFFIMTILKHHGLTDCFSEINTNPGYVDEEGRLRIKPYHEFTASPHGCSLCPPNMCKVDPLLQRRLIKRYSQKGLVIERMQASALAEGKKKFIYLGDGKGDYCPCLKLREDDYVMPRKSYPLWELICSKTEALKAEVHEWKDAEELETVLLELIAKAVIVDRSSASQLFSADCKFENILLCTPEALPQTVRVPN